MESLSVENETASREMSALSLHLNGNCYFKSLIIEQTMGWLCAVSKQTCDKRYFYYCYDRAMDTQVCCLYSQALIKGSERAASTSGGKSPAQRDRKKEKNSRGGLRHK